VALQPGGRTAGEGGPPAWRLGEGLTNPHLKKRNSFLGNVTHDLVIGRQNHEPQDEKIREKKLMDEIKEQALLANQLNNQTVVNKKQFGIYAPLPVH
jgi:hypothetical protein